MRSRIAVAVLLSLVLVVPSPARAALVGLWTFESGMETVDVSGNWTSLTLGGATIADGQLNLDLAPAATWAIAEGYTGPDIVEKTLVSWISLDDLTNPRPAGSAITIDRSSVDEFDGIIFAERQDRRWMNGSSYFRRTQDFDPGFEETATDELIQLAFTYEDVGGGDVRITGYRNGQQIGQYTSGSLASWTAGDAEVFFGIRHGSPAGGPGGLDAHLEEARVYNEALTQQEIQALDFLTLDTLTWDGTPSGDWGTAHWLGANPPPPPDFPVDDETYTIRAIIDTPGATVNVAAPERSAATLDLLAGQLAVGAGNTLAITYGLNGAGGTVALGNDAQLAAGAGGSVGAMSISGKATVDVGADMVVAALTNTGPAATFVKKGNGALQLDNSSGAAIDFGGSSLQIDAGTLALGGGGSDVLGGASSVILNAGTLSLSGPPPTVAPPLPTGNLVLHLNAGDLAVGDGNPVDVWTDASTAANDVSQDIVDQQPILVENVVGGQSVVRFDGNDFLTRPGDVLAEGDDDYTYVAVWYPTQQGVMTVLEQAGEGNGRRAAMLAVNANYGFNGQGNDRHDLVPYSPNQWAMSIMTIDNSQENNVVILHNGDEYVGRSGNPGALNVGVDAFNVAKKVYGDEYLFGDMAELLVYDSALSGIDAQQIGLHLAFKYGFDTDAWGRAPLDARDLIWSVNGDSRLFVDGGLGSIISAPRLTGGVLTVDGPSGVALQMVAATIDASATSVGFDTRIPLQMGPITHEDGPGKQPATIVTRGSVPLVLAQTNTGLENDLFNVQSGELRMVDLAPWGGSTEALLSGGRLTIVAAGGDVDMTTHRLGVDGPGVLEADGATVGSLSFGPLTLFDGGILGTAGSPIGFHGGDGLPDTVIDAGATLVGFDCQTDTDPGAVDGGNAGATIRKTGNGTLLLDEPNVNMAGSTFEVQAGTLNVVMAETAAKAAVSPLADAALLLGGGEILLSGRVTDSSPVFDTPAQVTGDGSVTAGQGTGASGPVDVTLGSPANPTSVAAGASLTLQAEGDYSLSLADVGGEGGVTLPAGPVSIGAADVGRLQLSGGQLSLPGGGTAGEVVLSDGSLTLGGNLDVTTARASGGTLDLGGHEIVIAAELEMGDADYEISQGDTFSLTGTDVTVDPTLVLSSGTLTVSVSTLPTDNLALHLAANAVSGVANGGPVAEWNDLSGRQNHVTQDVADQQPTLVENVVGGLPVVRFDGNDFLTRAGDVLDEGDDDYTYVAVWYPTQQGIMTVLEQAGSGASRRASLLAVNANYGFNGQNNDLHGLVPYNPNEWITSIMTVDNAAAENVHILHNGQEFTGSTPNPGALDVGVDAFNVAKKVYGGEYLFGDVAELLVYDGVLSVEDYDTLVGFLTEKYTGGKAVPGVIDEPNTNLSAVADSTLALVSVGTATLGNLSLEAGVRLSITGAEASFQDISAGHDATIAGTVFVRGNLAPGASAGRLKAEGFVELGETAVYQAEIGTWDSTNLPNPWNPPLDPPVNDMVQVSGGDLLLAGELDLAAVDKLHPRYLDPVHQVEVEWYGDQVRTIAAATGENSVLFEFETLPDPQPESWDDIITGTAAWSQGHIGRGAFLIRGGPDGTGVEYDLNTAKVHLFQAADGDTNGDRNLGGRDIQNIQSFALFGLTEDPGPGYVWPPDWPQGDFDGDRLVTGLDISAVLATGLWPTDGYAAVEPGTPLDGVVDLLLYPQDVTLDDGTVIPAGTLIIDPDGLTINGYVLRSDAGIFTGGPAKQLNWFFVEDTDRQISGNMGVTLADVHDLGPVVGPQWMIINPFDKNQVNPFDDLTLTYTVVGTPGTFVGNLIIVPEPGTLVMLVAGALGLLLVAARRRGGPASRR